MTVEEARRLTKEQRSKARARGLAVPFLPKWRGGRYRRGHEVTRPRGAPKATPCLVKARTGRLCSFCRVKAAMYANAIKKLDGTHRQFTDEDRRRGRAARGLAA